ncbi:integrase core domain-containing protein [Alteromonas lipotrueiana]
MYIQPGKPKLNRCIERFAGSFCREFFDAYPFKGMGKII